MATGNDNWAATALAGALAACALMMFLAFRPPWFTTLVGVAAVGTGVHLYRKKKLKGQWGAVVWWMLGSAAVTGAMASTNLFKHSPNDEAGDVPASDTVPRRIKPPMVTITDDSPVAHKLASIDNRGERLLTVKTVHEYEVYLEVVDKKCRENQNTIADMVVYTAQELRKKGNGHDENNLDVLKGLNTALGDGTSYTECDKMLAGLLMLVR